MLWPQHPAGWDVVPRLLGPSVLIDHGDGTAGLYMHLAPNSVVVHVGDHVCAGQPLGTDGHTGWATATHLHFQVEPTPTAQTSVGWWWGSSEQTLFSDPDVTRQQPTGVPVTNGSYISANAEAAGCATTAPPTPTSTPTPTLKPTSKPTPKATPPPLRPPAAPTAITVSETVGGTFPDLYQFYVIAWREPTAGGPAAGFRLYSGGELAPGPGCEITGYPAAPGITAAGSVRSVTVDTRTSDFVVACNVIVAFNAAGSSRPILFTSAGYGPATCEPFDRLGDARCS